MKSVPFLKEVNPSDEEFKLFTESKKENRQCAEDLSVSINEHYNDYSLDTKAVMTDMLDKYSPERIAYVLAVRVHDNDGFDKRISKFSENWGKTLLSEIPDLYKSKETSPIKSDLCSYISSHNGLVDILVNTFDDVFPDINLVDDGKPITSKLSVAPCGPSYADEDKFDTDFEDDMDCAYLCFEMKIPPALVMYELLSRVPDFGEFYPNCSLEEFIYDRTYTIADFEEKSYTQGIRDSCFARVYENGKVDMSIIGHPIPLTNEEEVALAKILEGYTKINYRATLPQTVLAAMNGTSPDELRSKGKMNQEKNFKEDI